MATTHSPATGQSAALIARLDRLPARAVRFAATGIAGLGLGTIFYCNFDINGTMSKVNILEPTIEYK